MNTKIVRDSAGYLYEVLGEDPSTPQAYLARPVKAVKGGYAPKSPSLPRLIRKAGTTVLEAE